MAKIAVVTGNPKPASRTHSVALAVADALAKGLPDAETDPVIDLAGYAPRVFDWADVANDRWFIPDGIHYYSPGYVSRSHDIAHGLLHAFPEGQSPSASCVVH